MAKQKIQAHHRRAVKPNASGEREQEVYFVPCVADLPGGNFSQLDAAFVAANSERFEIVESATSRAILAEGWVRDPRWTKKDIEKGAQIANDAAMARIKAAFLGAGMTEEEAVIASRDPQTNIDTELAGRGTALLARLGKK